MSFLAFAGDSYYPEGGWGDFLGAYATVDEAKQRIEAGRDVDAVRSIWKDGEVVGHEPVVVHSAFGWGHVVAFVMLSEEHRVLCSWRHPGGHGRPNDPGEWSEGYDRW